MSGLSPFDNIYLHFRNANSAVRVRSIEDALELAAARIDEQPYRVTSGNGELLLDEEDLKTELGI